VTEPAELEGAARSELVEADRGAVE